jgi:predicted RNA binding protein YcfA (HicA-like mRNA interferase family)
LPVVSGRDVVKALRKLGYEEARQQGSHIRLWCEGKKSVSVPDHKVIGRGLPRKILRDAELSPEDFRALL